MSSLAGGTAPRRATVVGAGLIGGSIGMALRAQGWHVCGHDLDSASLDLALACGAIDEVGVDEASEITFVATPLEAVEGAVRAALEATLPEDREHVTPYLYRTRPELFRLRHWTLPGIAAPDERWTVDTPEDFELVRALLEHFGPAAETVTTAELLAFIQTRPDLRALNRHVVQKTLAALPNR